ncbi:hypothetical protein FHS56_000004 [Thermonema lapsum]|uniref:Glycosyl hydrolase family 32 N-terminal domain-containing protein n=1 Tax=Thermonema lapsum TaxID=28195 RepID=A0A846MLX6_9BACT|nr:hypothetical protein [Thermonema lapsum]NIK72518.1 hypothetical protein [Thermonema lapsum]
MKWKKLKHLYAPQADFEWRQTHAANPFGEWISSDQLMVYFSCRDACNRSHISALILRADKDFEIEALCSRPLLCPGEPGLFDDSGVAMGYLITKERRRLLYYLGWNLKVTVPWLNTIGLAISEEEGEDGFPIFQKYSRAPLLDRSHEDPFSISYPSVLYDAGKYRMWYGSNLSWGKDETSMRHVFKYAESKDAIHWERSGKVVLHHIYDNEFALSKPFVIKEQDGTYSMWYSYRGNGSINTYRIGYATSSDGLEWVRRDKEVGIDVSADGWDSDMICYPFVFDYQGQRFMLYNGNGYGKTGFGIAMLVSK